MPELDWRFGYPFALALMLLVSVGLYIIFRRRRWISQRRRNGARIGSSDEAGRVAAALVRQVPQGRVDPAPRRCGCAIQTLEC